jgi:anaerobic ribonucleoside-triphosphate reductase activating protein
MICRVHAIEPASRANGPGLRTVIWFQGCRRACPGCFNPLTHAADGGVEMETEELANRIATLGVSISGGEPFEQPEALLDLVQRLRARDLSILIYSGYAIEEIRAMPAGPPVLGAIDILIDGPYIDALRGQGGFPGSANQRIHLLTSRHRPEEFVSLPRTEIILHRDGSITLTGAAPPRLGGRRGRPWK